MLKRLRSNTSILLALVLSSQFLTGAAPPQSSNPAPKPTSQFADIVASYEGQTVSSVDLAGRPELKTDELRPLLSQGAGEPFSLAKVNETIERLKRTGQFEDVQPDVRPEPDGVRVMFVLQPAVYFGMYSFSGADDFSYSRLLQVSKYSSPEPYSPIDVQQSQAALELFFKRNGYFQATVRPEVQTDQAQGVANVTFHITLNERARFGELIVTGDPLEETLQPKRVLGSFWARLRGAAIRPGKKFKLGTVENATEYLENSLTKKRYLGAQVQLVGADYNSETNRADVRFDVKPGPLVRVNVEGAHLWSWTKHRLLPIYQESGLGPELIQEGRQNLISHFQSKGFFDVQVNTEVEEDPSEQTVLYRITKGKQRKIVDVTFTGNQHLSDEELLPQSGVSTASFLSFLPLFSQGKYDEKSVRNLRAAYQAAGFNEVKVTPQFQTSNGDIVVNFVIEEGPQDIVESLRIEGNDSIPISQSAPDGLRLSEGQPYSQKSIDDDRNKIIAHYLQQGYLTASFRETAEPLPDNPHRYAVVYTISEGPQVHAESIVTIGRQATVQRFINREITELQPGKPLAEHELLRSETRLYTTGVFDWAQIDPRRRITTQGREDVIVKVHEGKRNSLTYGIGFEMVNRGGSIPSGTVALPGLPPVGLPDTFQTSEQRVKGPRASFQYTRSNVRGQGESITIGALAGPLVRRATFNFTDPNFRWTSWSANLSALGENNKENPIFTSRQAQFGYQLQRALDAKKTQNLFLRYSYTETGLANLVIPELVPEQDRHTRLSTLSANYIRDTRDNPIDATKGTYQSAQLDLNLAALGSSVSFAKILGQAAYYRDIHSGIIWANSIRVGFEHAISGSHVPVSQKFFTGGGSTLRGFPLNGAGQQRSIPVCNPDDTASCTNISVPVGGTQLLILNTELRFPVPLKKGLSFVTFYDGGNVTEPVGLRSFRAAYTNSIGVGFRFATPVGPIRFDIGHNLNALPGIKPTQYFITLGQAF